MTDNVVSLDSYRKRPMFSLEEYECDACGAPASQQIARDSNEIGRRTWKALRDRRWGPVDHWILFCDACHPERIRAVGCDWCGVEQKLRLFNDCDPGGCPIEGALLWLCEGCGDLSFTVPANT